MTDQKIKEYRERMIAHLDRLLLNKDMSQKNYDFALKDLAQWQEAAMLKLREERAVKADVT